MWQIAVAARAGDVCMHMRGEPATMQEAPVYADVLGEVAAFFEERLERLAEAGLAAEQVALDPGIGFGKALEHNLALLAGLESFKKMQRPLLVGASRKSFIGQMTQTEVQDRLPGSLACVCRAAQAGAGIVRVHDVAATVQALAVWEGIAQE